MSEIILEVDALARHFPLPRQRLFAQRPLLRALDGVSFRVAARQSFAVVGESGSGKSTLARLVMALDRPSAGRVRLFGRDLQALSRRELRWARRDFQMVFQDPYGSLDPRQKVLRLVAEPLAALGEEDAAGQRRRVGEMLEAVGLRAADMGKYPHEFSGGQRQRIAIARALVTRPRLIVADEPVSALDVSVQAQVLNLLQDMQREFGVTYLLISHDLAVVDYVCEEAAVMYRGRIVEQGPTATLFRAAAHPYTRALLDAVPQPLPGRRRPPAAQRPEADEEGSGCPYAGRCPLAEPRCRAEAPALRPVGERHLAACHRAESVMGAGAASR
jgi:peptide/nickel transport system ATP-binding protein